MFDLNSIDYYQMREKRERALACAAADPRATAIHLDLAARYSSLANRPLRPAGPSK
jgi:hypothetical protein